MKISIHGTKRYWPCDCNFLTLNLFLWPIHHFTCVWLQRKIFLCKECDCITCHVRYDREKWTRERVDRSGRILLSSTVYHSRDYPIAPVVDVKRDLLSDNQLQKQFQQKKSAPNVGLEPTTLRLRVSCSTDWASRARYACPNNLNLNLVANTRIKITFMS